MTLSETDKNKSYSNEMSDLCKSALSAINDGVVITDPNGNIKWVNRAFETYTGYSIDELINKNPSILKSDKHDSSFYKTLWSTILAGNCWKGEIWNKRKDGVIVLEEQSITPIKDQHSCITHFIAINRDITEKKNIHDELNNARRIEAIGQLTAGVAHNFNNKLASILGFADLALDEIKQYDNDDLNDSINEIITAGKFARDLVKQMMAFSITTQGKPKPVDLHLAINQAVKKISTTLPAEVQVLTEFNTVPLVIFDPVRLHQMLISLAVNAYAAMNKKGELIFSLGMSSCDEIHCSSCHDVISGEYVSLSVRDTGKGILGKDIENIFMPFFTARQYDGGTGMGLSALHGMLHDMGGHVLVDSVVGEFAEFKLLFPVPSEAEDDLTEITDSGIKHNKLNKIVNILIVDDDESVANFMFEVLSLNSYQVTRETSSKKALKTFSDNPNEFDILITDQSMPHLSGTELVKLFHEIRHDLPVILMTGYSESELSIESENINAMLIKPFDTKDLLKKINTI